MHLHCGAGVIMRKHSPEMTAAWAKDWGIRGYEHLDPQQREKNRQHSMKKLNERKRKEQNFRRR